MKILITVDGLPLGAADLSEVAFMVGNELYSKPVREGMVPIYVNGETSQAHPRVSLIGNEGILTLNKRFRGGRLLAIPGGVLLETAEGASVHLASDSPMGYVLVWKRLVKPEVAQIDECTWLDLPTDRDVRLDMMAGTILVEVRDQLLISAA